MNFAGRHIVVTGASTGIGFATAKTLSRRGAIVSLLARNEEKLTDATAALQRDGGMAGYAVADVSDQDSLQAAKSL